MNEKLDLLLEKIRDTDSVTHSQLVNQQVTISSEYLARLHDKDALIFALCIKVARDIANGDAYVDHIEMLLQVIRKYQSTPPDGWLGTKQFKRKNAQALTDDDVECGDLERDSELAMMYASSSPLVRPRFTAEDVEGLIRVIHILSKPR